MSAREANESAAGVAPISRDVLPSMNPDWYPLAAAIRGDLRRLNYKIGSVTVRLSPRSELQAAAQCRFDRDEIQLAEQYWIGVRPDNIGTDEYYLKHRKVLGSVWHELGHWLFSEPNIHAWVMQFPKAHRKTATLMEESRVESLFLKMVREGDFEHRSDDLIREVLRQSIYSMVLSEINATPDEMDSWQKISELMLLVQARIYGQSATTNEPRIKAISEALKGQMESYQWERARELIAQFHQTYDPTCRFATADTRASSFSSNPVAAADRAFSRLIRTSPIHRSKRNHQLIVANWVALMEEIAKSVEENQPEQEEDQQQQEEEGDSQCEQDGQPEEQDDEQSSDESEGDESDEVGDEQGEEGNEGQGEGEDESDETSDEHGDGSGNQDGEDGDGKPDDSDGDTSNDEQESDEGKPTGEQGEDRTSRSPLDKLFDSIREESKESDDIDFKPSQEDANKIKQSLARITAATNDSKALWRNSRAKNRAMWNA
jgi:hypothetical protein